MAKVDSESACFYPSWESEFQEKATAAASNIQQIEQNSEELNSLLDQKPTGAQAASRFSANIQLSPKEQQLQKDTSMLAQDTKALMHEMRRYLIGKPASLLKLLSIFIVLEVCFTCKIILLYTFYL